MKFLSSFTKNPEKRRVYGLLVVFSFVVLVLGYLKPLLAYQSLQIFWAHQGAEVDKVTAKVDGEEKH